MTIRKSSKQTDRHVNEEQLWFALDMDGGVIAAAMTRRRVMELAGVPTRAAWSGRWERYTYGPGSEEIVWGYRCLKRCLLFHRLRQPRLAPRRCWPCRSRMGPRQLRASPSRVSPGGSA